MRHVFNRPSSCARAPAPDTGDLCQPPSEIRFAVDPQQPGCADGGEIGVGAGDVGGQALALGLIDYVAIDVVIQGSGVLHFRFAVSARARRSPHRAPANAGLFAG